MARGNGRTSRRHQARRQTWLASDEMIDKKPKIGEPTKEYIRSPARRYGNGT